MIFRAATRSDVPDIVGLLADDPLGQGRESSDLVPYLAAYDEIRANPATMLIVGALGGRVIACYQLTILAGLSRQGARRGLIEAVRVAPSLRSQGYGAALMADCEIRARAAGATILQLTTDRTRTRAHGFYDRLGFVPSHIGYKKALV